MLKSLGIIALLSSASVAACASNASDDDSASEAASVADLKAVKGREYARCWFDVVEKNAQLSCTASARGSDPIGATVNVTVSGSGGVKQTLDTINGGTFVVGSFALDSFPRDVSLDAVFDDVVAKAVGSDKKDFSAQAKKAVPADLQLAKPLVFAQPFDLWPVAITARPNGSTLAATAYSAKDLKFTPDLSFSGDAVHWLVAPASGPIAVAATVDGKPVATSIPGPGRYTLDATGLHDGKSPTPPVDHHSATDAGAAPATADTHPECGGDKQAYCAQTYSCDAGTRLDSFSNQCVACGADGQPYCYLDPAGMSMSAGTRCNPGTRLEMFSNRCVACGGAGQTYCYSDPNGVSFSAGNTCSSGLRLSAASKLCEH